MKIFAKYFASAAICAAMLMVAAPSVEAALTSQEQTQVASLLTALNDVGNLLQKLKAAFFAAPSVAQAAVACDGSTWQNLGEGKEIVGIYLESSRDTEATKISGSTSKTDAIGVVARGNDNAIYYNWYQFVSGAWRSGPGQAWSQVPGYFSNKPSPTIGTYKGSAWDVLTLGSDGGNHHIINWGTGWANEHVDSSPHVSYGGQTSAVDGQGRTWYFQVAGGKLQYKCGGGSTANTAPFGSIDAPAGGTTVSGTVTITGWVLDKEQALTQNPKPTLRFYIDNNKARLIPTTGIGDVSRSDVCNTGWVQTQLGGSPCNPNSGFQFTWDSRYQGDPSFLVANGTHTLYIDAIDNGGLTATFGLITVNVQNVTAGPNTLSVTKTGNGTITSNPAGIDCPTNTCSANFANGTSVILTATAASGSTFAGWSGEGCSGTGTCVVTMNVAKSVTATFNGPAGAISITSPATGTTWQKGSSATITWTPTNASPVGPIYLFKGTSAVPPIFGSALSNPNGTYTFTVPTSLADGTDYKVRIVTNAAETTWVDSAVFSIQMFGGAGPFTLTVTKAGTGSGTVSDNATPKLIDACGSFPCSATYTSGTNVVLNALAASGSTFAGWSGEGCSGTGTCVVTMNVAKSVTATFNLTTVSGIPNPAGNATCSDAAGFGNEQSLGGGTPSGSTPATENFGSDDRLIVVTRGNDNGVYAREWKKQGSVASVDIPWYQVKSGYMSGDPKLVVENGQLWLYVKSGDNTNTIYKIQYTGGSSTSGQSNWSNNWSIITGKIASTDFGASGPTAVATLPPSWGTYQVSRRSSDGAVVVKSCDIGGATTLTVTNTVTNSTPTQGPVGTAVTINGTGFTATNNTITIKDASGVSVAFNIPASVINPGTSISFVIPNLLTGVTYSIFVKNGNGLTPDPLSNPNLPFTVTTTSSVSTLIVTLTASPTTVNQGSTVTVNWNVTNPTTASPKVTTRDWIGLFAVGAQNTSYVDFKYNDINSGQPCISNCSLTFAAPSPGTYEFRYLPRDFYVPAGRSNQFIVQNTSGAVIPTLTFTANPSNIQAGQSSALTWNFSDSSGSCVFGRGSGVSLTSGGALFDWSSIPSTQPSIKTSGTVYAAPTITTGYDLTCTSAAGQTVKLSRDIIVTASVSTTACSAETQALIRQLINDAIVALTKVPPDTATAAAKISQASQLLAACITVTPPGGTTTGTIEIKRVGSSETTSDVPTGTKAWIDNLTSGVSANPAFFPSKPTGSHTAYATDVGGYTKTAGICNYPVGGVGGVSGSECSVTDFTTVTPSCDGTRCSVPVSVTSNQVSKVVFKYVNVGSGGAVCGNGIVESGEQCDPPNGSICSATCQLVNGSYSVSVAPTSGSPTQGAALSITWAAPSSRTTLDWVGLFKVTDTADTDANLEASGNQWADIPDPDSTNITSGTITRTHVNSTNTNFVVPSNAVSNSLYEIRYLRGSGPDPLTGQYQRLAVSLPITVSTSGDTGVTPTLRISPSNITTYSIGSGDYSEYTSTLAFYDPDGSGPQPEKALSPSVVTWTSDDTTHFPKVANSGSLSSGVSWISSSNVGITTAIHATYNGKSASAPVTILYGARPAPPNAGGKAQGNAPGKLFTGLPYKTGTTDILAFNVFVGQSKTFPVWISTGAVTNSSTGETRLENISGIQELLPPQDLTCNAPVERTLTGNLTATPTTVISCDSAGNVSSTAAGVANIDFVSCCGSIQPTDKTHIEVTAQ